MSERAFIQAIQSVSFGETKDSQQSLKFAMTKLQVKILFPNL